MEIKKILHYLRLDSVLMVEKLIFESSDVNIGWDGYYRGKLCQEDVYVWKVNAILIDGSTLKQAGDVTLLVY